MAESHTHPLVVRKTVVSDRSRSHLVGSRIQRMNRGLRKSPGKRADQILAGDSASSKCGLSILKSLPLRHGVLRLFHGVALRHSMASDRSAASCIASDRNAICVHCTPRPISH